MRLEVGEGRKLLVVLVRPVQLTDRSRNLRSLVNRAARSADRICYLRCRRDRDGVLHDRVSVDLGFDDCLPNLNLSRFWVNRALDIDPFVTLWLVLRFRGGFGKLVRHNEMDASRCAYGGWNPTNGRFLHEGRFRRGNINRFLLRRWGRPQEPILDLPYAGV